MESRLQDLKSKMINKIKTKYIDENHNIFNKYSDYLIESDPINEPKTIIKSLYNKYQPPDLL